MRNRELSGMEKNPRYLTEVPTAPNEWDTICTELLGRVSDPAESADYFAVANEQLAEVGGVTSRPECSLASGFGSLAVLFGSFARQSPGSPYKKVAHEYITRMATSIAGSPQARGMFADGGLAGLRFATAVVAAESADYANFMERVDKMILEQTLTVVGMLNDQPTGASYFDLIGGLSGTIAATLTGASRPLAKRTASVAVEALAARVEACGAHAFLVPPGLLPYGTDTAAFPDGYISTGLAHGVAGVVAAMSIAKEAAVPFGSREEQALRLLSDWLVAERTDDEWGPNWPFHVATDVPSSVVSQSGWCYGPAGIARALELASNALGDPGYSEQAREALLGIAARPPAHRRLPGPGICHGRAGLLTVLSASEHAAVEPGLVDLMASLRQGLVDECDPEAPAGYRDWVMGTWVDDPGLLSGSAGILLALRMPPKTISADWRRGLLLA